jgi:hypothetical protein
LDLKSFNLAIGTQINQFHDSRDGEYVKRMLNLLSDSFQTYQLHQKAKKTCIWLFEILTPKQEPKNGQKTLLNTPEHSLTLLNTP